MSEWLIVAMIVAQAADVTSTCAALRRGRVEANPMYPNSCKGIAAETVAIDVSLVWLVQKKVKGKWKRAVIYGGVATAAGFGAAWNASH